MSLWHETLARVIALIDQKIAEADAHIGDLNSRAFDAWSARRREADDMLVNFVTAVCDGRFTRRTGDQHIVRIAGIQSSSTSGPRSALRNWQSAARKKLGQEVG